MKKLPKIYQGEINKKIKNNKEFCHLETKTIENKTYKNKKPNEEIIDEIFSGIGYSYNIPVIIETKNKVYNTSLIAKTKNNLITLDNEIIPISEIIIIKKQKDK